MVLRGELPAVMPPNEPAWNSQASSHGRKIMKAEKKRLQLAGPAGPMLK